MKLFIKILLFVFVSLVTNVEVVNASIIFPNVHKITISFSSQNTIAKTSFKVTENDLANSCKNEWDLVDYRDWGKGIEAVAAKGVLNVEQRTLQHMFGRHAKDFGVTGNWSKAMAGEFEGVLRTHMKGLTPIQGTYRGTQQVLHYYNPSTGLNVMTDISGNLVGGWKLSADQIKYLLSTGAVK